MVDTDSAATRLTFVRQTGRGSAPPTGWVLILALLLLWGPAWNRELSDSEECCSSIISNVLPGTEMLQNRGGATLLQYGSGRGTLPHAERRVVTFAFVRASLNLDFGVFSHPYIERLSIA